MKRTRPEGEDEQSKRKGLVDSSNCGLVGIDVYAMPREIWEHVLCNLNFIDLWNLTIASRGFNLLLKRIPVVNNKIYSVRGQLVRMHDFLPSMDDSHWRDFLNSTDKDAITAQLLFENLSLLKKSISWDVTREYFSYFPDSRKVCELQQIFMLSDHLSDFIEPSAKAEAWNPDTQPRCLLQSFSLLNELVPAMRLGCNKFTPAFLHSFILPVRRNERTLTDAELDIFARMGPAISPAFEIYFGHLLIALCIENIIRLHTDDFESKSGPLRDLIEKFGLSWKDMIPVVEIPEQFQILSEYGTPLYTLASLGIMRSGRANFFLLASQWGFDLEKIEKNIHCGQKSEMHDILSAIPRYPLGFPVPFDAVKEVFGSLKFVINGYQNFRALFLEHAIWQ